MESHVCICGAGTMGRGITLNAATHGVQSILYDLDLDMLTMAKSWIKKELENHVAKKRITATEKKNIEHRISYTGDLSDCIAPLIIEAILEKTQAKCILFKDLATVNDENTIYATNTSSLTVTDIAAETMFPERVIGLHFFNPAHRMKLVEVIRTKFISDGTLKRATDFLGQIGKTAVVCQDAPGFIVNHVARPYYLEALRLVEHGVAPIATIDRLMESAGFRMGPFHVMDLIGNDINYTVSRSLYEALGEPARLKPSGLQEANVKKGLLGQKTGSGFFQYTKPAAE